MNDGNSSWALITGSSQGLGRAFAEECAGRGMNLVFVPLPDTGLNEVSRILERTCGVSLEAVEMDLTAPEAPAALYLRLRQKNIEIDTLINNAGVGYHSRFGDSTLRENEATIELNVGARVIMVSSGSHCRGRMHWADLKLRRAYNGLAAYEQSKLAVVLFTREFACRLRTLDAISSAEAAATLAYLALTLGSEAERDCIGSSADRLLPRLAPWTRRRCGACGS